VRNTIKQNASGYLHAALKYSASFITHNRGIFFVNGSILTDRLIVNKSLIKQKDYRARAPKLDQGCPLFKDGQQLRNEANNPATFIDRSDYYDNIYRPMKYREKKRDSDKKH